MWSVLLSGLAFVLTNVVGSVVGRALIVLFVGFVTYEGITTTTDWIYAAMQNSLTALPSDIANFLGFLWVDKAVTTMFSAYSAALAVKLAGGTSITKTFTKKQ